MAKTRLVTEFAEQAGKSFDEAKQIVDDLGEGTARDVLNKGENALSWKVPATATAVSGGALGWRQQNVWKAQANADESQAESNSLGDILSSDDLTPEQKRQLAQQALNQSGQDDSGGNDDGNGLLQDLLGDNVQKTILMVVVLLIVVAFAQNYAGSVAQDLGDLSE